MTILEQIRDIFWTPKKAWPVVWENSKEGYNIQKKFVLPLFLWLTLIVAVSALSKALNVPDCSFGQVAEVLIKDTLTFFITLFVGFYIAVLLVNSQLFLKYFGEEPNMERSICFIAYSSLVMVCVRAIVIFWSYGFFLYILYFYTVYIIWEAVPALYKKIDEQKRVWFTLLSVAVLFASSEFVKIVLNKIIN